MIPKSDNKKKSTEEKRKSTKRFKSGAEKDIVTSVLPDYESEIELETELLKEIQKIPVVWSEKISGTIDLYLELNEDKQTFINKLQDDEILKKNLFTRIQPLKVGNYVQATFKNEEAISQFKQLFAEVNVHKLHPIGNQIKQILLVGIHLTKLDQIEIVQKLKLQNVLMANANLSVHRIYSRSNNKAAIINVDSNLVEQLLENPFVNIGNNAIRFTGYLPITQCMKCALLGHGDSKCPNSVIKCCKCARKHEIKNCSDYWDKLQLKVDFKCCNCDLRNSLLAKEHQVDTKHTSMDITCPSRRDYMHYQFTL